MDFPKLFSVAFILMSLSLVGCAPPEAVMDKKFCYDTPSLGDAEGTSLNNGIYIQVPNEADFGVGPFPTVLFFHGIGEDVLALQEEVDELADQGWVAASADYRDGVVDGKTDGAFRGPQDARCAVRYLRAHAASNPDRAVYEGVEHLPIDIDKIAVVGYSLGGVVASSVAFLDDEEDAKVFAGTPGGNDPAVLNWQNQRTDIQAFVAYSASADLLSIQTGCSSMPQAFLDESLPLPLACGNDFIDHPRSEALFAELGEDFQNEFINRRLRSMRTHRKRAEAFIGDMMDVSCKVISNINSELVCDGSDESIAVTDKYALNMEGVKLYNAVSPINHAATSSESQAARLPILFQHGIEDTMVRPEFSLYTNRYLQHQNYISFGVFYRDQGHVWRGSRLSHRNQLTWSFLSTALSDEFLKAPSKATFESVFEKQVSTSADAYLCGVDTDGDGFGGAASDAIQTQCNHLGLDADNNGYNDMIDDEVFNHALRSI